MPPDPIVLALIRHLCREGIIVNADIEQIAAGLDANGFTDEAHAVRCEWLAATSPETQPARLSLVRSDGGN